MSREKNLIPDNAIGSRCSQKCLSDGGLPSDLKYSCQKKYIKYTRYMYMYNGTTELQKIRRDMEGIQSIWASPSLQETATYRLDMIR